MATHSRVHVQSITLRRRTDGGYVYTRQVRMLRTLGNTHLLFNMSLNLSSSSEHLKKSLEESIPTEKTKKFKKPGVISHLTRRTPVKPKGEQTQHTPMKKKNVNPKLVAGGVSEVTKTSTLPRSFKPNKTPSTSFGQSLGRFGLTRSSNNKKSGPSSPQPSTVKQSSKWYVYFCFKFKTLYMSNREILVDVNNHL